MSERDEEIRKAIENIINSSSSSEEAEEIIWGLVNVKARRISQGMEDVRREMDEIDSEMEAIRSENREIKIRQATLLFGYFILDPKRLKPGVSRHATAAG